MLIARRLPPVITALAARFTLQDNLADCHALIQGLAHVINGKRGQRSGHQRLHLDPGWGGSDSSRVNLDAILAYLSTHINERERQRMAHWYQFSRSLGRCDAR